MPDLNLRVKVDVAGAPAVSGLSADFESAGKSVDRLGSVSQGAFERMGHKIVDIGTSLIGAGISAAVDAIGNSIELASNKAESASKVAVLYGASADAITAASNNAATSVGLSSGAYLEAAGNLGNLTLNLGFTQEQAAGMSVDMIALAADMGSFNNADTSAVTAAMGAAFRGETEPIRQFGVMLSDAGVKAKAVSLGLYDGVGALTANAKAQATYQLILEQTSAAQGDFSRTADGLANQQKISAAKQEEAWTRLGSALLPIATAIMPMIADAVTAIVDVVMVVIGWVQDWMRDNKALIDTLGRVAGVIIGALKTAFDVVIPILKLMFTWWGFLIDIFGKAFGVITDFGSKVFGSLIASIKSVVDWFTGLWATIQNIGGKIMDFLGGIFRPLINGIQTAVGFVRDAWNTFARFWNGVGIDIPKITIPNPFGGDVVLGGGRFELPHLPILDRGGIVTGPTLAALAQNNRPEAVIPLDRLGAMGAVTVNVYAGVGDPVEIGRQVVEVIRQYERANGPAF